MIECVNQMLCHCVNQMKSKKFNFDLLFCRHFKMSLSSQFSNPFRKMVLNAIQTSFPVESALVVGIVGMIVYFMHLQDQADIRHAARAAEQEILRNEQLRLDQEDEKRREQEQQQAKEEEEEEEAWCAASDVIDLYIRSRRRFNTAVPSEYRCKIKQIEIDCEDDLDGLEVESVCEWDDDRFNVNTNDYSVNVLHLTPYQEAGRMFGHYECKECPGRRRWHSGSSWANKWQQCHICETRVYPHDQEQLTRRSVQDRRRTPLVHDTERCQMCIELGYDCHYLVKVPCY